MPTHVIYLIYIPSGDDPSTLYLNAITLSVCQYQLKGIFVCAIVTFFSLRSLLILYNTRKGLAGMVCAVLTAVLELIDMTCQH